MPANGRGCARTSSFRLIESKCPACKVGHFGPSAELLINQVEGRLIATSGNFFQRLWAVLTRGRSHGARRFADLPLFTSGLNYHDERHDGHQRLPAFLAKEWPNVA
jgi:hypothetical protein